MGVRIFAAGENTIFLFILAPYSKRKCAHTSCNRIYFKESNLDETIYDREVDFIWQHKHCSCRWPLAERNAENLLAHEIGFELRQVSGGMRLELQRLSLIPSL